ncbi:MAG: efflux RND transporter permease subunit, partial [Planctomycetota bacterium]
TGPTDAEFLPVLIARYPGITWSLTGGAREERLALDETITGWMLAMFGIYALMAIPLRSYLQPLIIMGVIPFGIVGAVVGHMVLGMAINVISLLGIIALSGVVVNDSLIMVDFVNKRRQAGESETSAAIESGSARLRPILLTSLTTFFGLIPIILERGAHAQMVMPMAVSLAFGILFATLITLILVPSLYVVLGDLRELVGLQRNQSPPRSAAATSTG